MTLSRQRDPAGSRAFGPPGPLRDTKHTTGGNDEISASATSIEMVAESIEETGAIAIQRSREAAERLWDEIVGLLAGDPFAGAGAVPWSASR